MSSPSASAAKIVEAEEYARNYREAMEFEAHLIAARQDCCLEFIQREQPQTVIEVGCGPVLLIDRFDLTASPIKQWLVVEPTSYADALHRRTSATPKLCLEKGYLEDRVAAIGERFPDGLDLALLSGLLHETTDPQSLLAAAKTVLKPGGSVLVIVPNALSFHRLLAVELGLIPAPTALSDRNRALGQPVVFDRASLEAIIRQAGFVDLQFSGYMFKPFSNDQMRQVVELLGAHLVAGLTTLGRAFPDHAAEIAVAARKPMA